MSLDQGRVTATPPAGQAVNEVQDRLSQLESRRFRGAQWLPAAAATAVGRFADERISALNVEVNRLRSEQRRLVSQVEMYRHGSLPSNRPQGPDPMVLELAMRAQDEANRTVDEANREGAEIIADARAQAAEIVAAAQRIATEATGYGGPAVRDLERRVEALQESNEMLAEAALDASHQLRQWQAHLDAQAERLRQDAASAAALSDRLNAAVEM